MDDNRHSWNIIPDVLVAIEKEGNSSARRITTRWCVLRLLSAKWKAALLIQEGWGSQVRLHFAFFSEIGSERELLYIISGGIRK
jgi:hypothetical protein